MPDFDDTRAELNAAREEHRDAREEVALARAAVRRAKGDRDAQALAAARERAERAETRLGDVRKRLGVVLGAFEPISDPRQEIGRLSAAFPLLLFPVRLETRFKTARDETGAERQQLWVRVYPDTCLIDTFEATLAEVEVEGASAYWKRIWRAGGIEADERAAWRALVASHGSGRAGWIVDNYRPANEPDRPTKGAPEEVVLVVATEAPLPSGERTALEAFWEAHWRADGVAAGEGAALAALRAAVGAARAEELVETTLPFNLGDRPPRGKTTVTAACSVAFVVLPAATTKDQPWTQAPTVELLPDRFLLIAASGEERLERLGRPVRSPLVVGPDPFAPESDQLHQQSGELVVPEELRWMVDFERAVDDGLGFKVNLTPAQASAGFERLYVVGVRLSDDPQQAKAALETLLTHHQHGRSGLSLLPQGTPTNNTERAGTGFSRDDDADASFDDRRQASLFTPESDWRRKQDGQCLAELLGIDPKVLARVRHSGGLDQRDARAMHTALWPATLGYFLGTMMDRVVDDEDVENTRVFFTRYVRGLGAVPSLRIGPQPYGILATTAFSRMGWPRRGGVDVAVRPTGPSFPERLNALIRRVDGSWAELARHVPAVSGDGDAHKSLLGILGLHPASAEFHYRYAQSLDHLFNHLNLFGIGPWFWEAWAAAALDAPALRLLRDLGWDGREPPPVLGIYFLGGQGALKGPLVDDPPLPDGEPVRRSWTADNRNYLQWLTDAARSSLDTLRRESGFAGNRPPTTLLYLLLRHALILGYDHAGRELHRSAGAESQVLRALKREPPFIHVDPRAQVSESRYASLYKTDPVVTAGTQRTVAEHIADILPHAAETEALREQVEAIELLEDASKARLERALVEHIDCCSYRFDAWQLGLVHHRLEGMRDGNGSGSRQGLHLGAYGWLEHVKPEPRELTPATLPDDLRPVFDAPGAPPLMHDSTNGGYIHAPSLNHAVTAAVLRNGYIANASAAAPDTMAVNLSSERVRLALAVLEGIRNGQSLGALLGYRLERRLHDGHGLVGLDRFIYRLRAEFPLRADHLTATKAPAGTSIEAIEARNVVDGLRLVEHVKRTGARNYPFGINRLRVDDATPGELGAIDAEVDGLLDVHDALADLALAEGVHQAVMGNFDRVGATLQTYTTGQHPPEPEVIRTPATGVTLTHRVGLHLKPGLAAPASATPRAIAEPALNDWLGGVLPPSAKIACRVHWTDPATGVAASPETVTMSQLGLQPLDLVELVRTEDDQAMTELDDRVLLRVIATRAPRPDAELEIRYMEHDPGQLSVFEVAPLAAHLRSLVVKARPLRASDVTPPTGARGTADRAVSADRARVAAVKQRADALAIDLAGFQIPPGSAAVLAGIDGLLSDAATLLARAGLLGVPEGGWGFWFTWRRTVFAELLERLRDRVARWDDRLSELTTRLTAYAALPPATADDERFGLLRQAEALVATTPDPLPAAPSDLRAAIGLKHGQLGLLRDQVDALADTGAPGLGALLTAVAALPPLMTPFDSEPFDLAEVEDRVVGFAAELGRTVAGVRDEVERRGEAAQDALDAHDAAAPGAARVDALQEAARALLGDDFRLFPEFTVDPSTGDDWQLAHAAGTGGELLQHLKGPLQVDEPVDEWMYGVARVRDPIRHLEQVILLCGAFELPEPELTPVQLPHVPGERWLALQFPSDQAIDSDRLLYTACYGAPFDKNANQCGLLLDEWTEVVPSDTAIPGIAFHYDQPSCEAPQTMLLVTPATSAPAWQWEDVTGALSETLELAKKRAVEPAQIDATAYARFLPATIMAATLHGISIATALAANNQVYELMRPDAPDA